jgi:hypothetical protein
MKATNKPKTPHVSHFSFPNYRILEATQYSVEHVEPICLTRSHSGGKSFTKLCLRLDIPSLGLALKAYIAYYLSFEHVAKALSKLNG